MLPVLRALFGAGAVTGVALTAYAARETRQFQLRRVEVPILPLGQRPLRVLHLSDIHMTPGQRAKQEWLASLSLLAPDLVVDTGDNLAHRDSVPVVRDSLGGLLDAPGVFVHGSNDYFEPTVRNPLRYLLPDTGRRNVDSPPLPWAGLTRALAGAGWLDLTNRAGVAGRRRDDVRLRRGRRPAPRLRPARGGAGPADPEADVRLGSRTRRTSGCSTSTPPTGTTRCSPATPTVARCACREAGRSPPTATSSRRGRGPAPSPR